MGNPLEPLIFVEEWVLEDLHALGLGWGLSIVALTMFVRAALLPLNVRQFRAQRNLEAHWAELKRLQGHYRDDRARLQQETVAYYRKHGITPLSALLPGLLQVPVFISLYYAMRADIASGLLGHAGFLFIPDLTSRPHGPVLVALVLTYLSAQAATSLIATRRLSRTHRSTALALPLLFVGVAARFPAGLLVYWITSGVWTLGQQVVFWRLTAARRHPPAKPA